MEELADVALLDNIQTGNLVDPTLGIPDRTEYFKLKPDGSGDYFEPSPGLWQSLKKSRNIKFYKSDRRYLLIYGELNLDQFRDRLTAKLIVTPIPVTRTRVGGVSHLMDTLGMATRILSREEQELYQKLSEATDLLDTIATKYGTNIIKFAGIADMKSYESITTGRFAHAASSLLYIHFTTSLRRKLHIFKLDLKIPSRDQYIDLVKQINENTNIEQIYKPDMASIVVGRPRISISNPEISLRMVALNTDDLLNGTLILPSLRDDVYDIN